VLLRKSWGCLVVQEKTFEASLWSCCSAHHYRTAPASSISGIVAMRSTLRVQGEANTHASSDPSRSNDGSLESRTKTPTVVTFQPGDPENPRNWPRWKKWSTIGSIILIDLTVSFGASGFSPAVTNFEKDMHVSSVVATLGLSIFVAGLAWGPVCIS